MASLSPFSYSDCKLPTIMVAPNGARRGKQDHSQLPVELPDIIHTAEACWRAGADGLHLHVRGDNEEHVLDAGRYREAIEELSVAVPNMFIQITTEAVGLYQPHSQRQVVRDVKPRAASVSIAEMLSDDDTHAAVDFYRWCEDEHIAIQHILYSTDDMERLYHLAAAAGLDKQKMQLLFVLGRYAKNQQSQPDDLVPFTAMLSRNDPPADWAVCAFGKNETACLQAAYAQGGKVRIGFENSLQHADGSIAADNAERVTEIKRVMRLIDASLSTDKKK